MIDESRRFLITLCTVKSIESFDIRKILSRGKEKQKKIERRQKHRIT